MSIKKLIKTLAVSLVLLVSPVAVFAQVPQLPHIFYGDVTINSSPAPVGTVIIAKVNGVEKGRVTTEATGKYGGPGAYDQKLLVQGNITSGAQITFTVSGVSGTPPSSFESGKVEQLNLSFVISQVEVTPSGLADLLNNGTLAVSGATESATSLNATQQVVINVAADGGTNKVVLPQGTTITKAGGGTFNANNLTANSVTASSLSGLGSGVVADGALQWGLSGIELQFSSPITITIFVGTSFNGQTLNITRSTSGSSGWTSDGIVSPATCVVSSGECTFSATKASYFLASHTVVTPTPSPAPTGGGGGGYYYSSDRAITAFTIPNQVGTTVINESAHTIALTMPYGTNVTALIPTITITGASVSPISATSTNFTTTQTYTVIAANGSTQTYIVAVTVAPTTLTLAPAPAIGQVLGVTTFNFAKNLSVGSRGDDVTELQNRLTQEGVYSGPITGYFGPLTLAGVKAYQAKYGISQVGAVGPLTRAQLNGSQVAGASTVNVAAIQAQIAALQAQLVVLLQQLLQMLQAQVR